MELPIPDIVHPDASGHYSVYFVPHDSVSRAEKEHADVFGQTAATIRALFACISRAANLHHLGKVNAISHMGGGYRFVLHYASPLVRDKSMGDSRVLLSFDENPVDVPADDPRAFDGTGLIAEEDRAFIGECIQSLGVIAEQSFRINKLTVDNDVIKRENATLRAMHREGMAASFTPAATILDNRKQ